jgi:hypothetical protein
MSVNHKLKNKLKEAVLAQFEDTSQHLSEGTGVGGGEPWDGRCLGRNSNNASAEYTSEMLHLELFAWLFDSVS